jgi:hypothetical protein
VLRYSNTLPLATTTGSPTYSSITGYHVYRFTGTGTIRFN